MHKARRLLFAGLLVPALLAGVAFSAPAATPPQVPEATMEPPRIIEPAAPATMNACPDASATAFPGIGPIPNATGDTALVTLISRTPPCFRLLDLRPSAP